MLIAFLMKWNLKLLRYVYLIWRKIENLLGDLTDETDEYTLPPHREVADYPPSEIVSRFEWGARPPSCYIDDLKTPVTAIVFHHTKSPQCQNKEECSYLMRKLQAYHMDDFGWPDIGYNFVVCGDGKVYEGRGWTKEGDHTDEWNHKSIGVAAMGDFTEEAPSNKMLQAIDQLVCTALKDNKYLKHDYSAMGHKQLDSFNPEYVCTCPGDAFYEEVKYMPHWTTGPLFVEQKIPDLSEYDSLYTTEFYFTDQYETPEEYPKGYDESMYGPKDPYIP